jgi:oryzin
MSLGTDGVVQSFNDAITGVTGAGITVVVAAGNANVSASTTSPGSAPGAIVVGAMDSSNKRASFSNWGSDVDVFAPGVSVLSAWIGASGTMAAYLSGTSMGKLNPLEILHLKRGSSDRSYLPATPHISGLIAYLMAKDGVQGNPAAANRLYAISLKNIISDAMGIQNQLGYNGNP